jgi:L-methionine (R)-S-oxide reductase
MWIINSNYNDPSFYRNLEKELLSLIQGEKNLIANLANISSWLFHTLPDLNWSGFYLWDKDDQELILGPFQGRPACLRIKSGKGVCGTSYHLKQTLLVENVELFPGHIACDSESKSELVIPLLKGAEIYGVLDLDSPLINRFGERDKNELEKIMNKLSLMLF